MNRQQRTEARLLQWLRRRAAEATHWPKRPPNGGSVGAVWLGAGLLAAALGLWLVER